MLDADIKNYLKEVVLDAYLRDLSNARTLQSDGVYKKVTSRASKQFDSQMFFVGRDER